MKTIIKLTKGTFLFCLLATIILFSFNSCAKKIAFQNSSVVPAARGTVEVKKDKNKNNVIKMDLKFLSEPNRLTPPKSVYVVWMTGADGATQNIGQIKSNNGLKVSFETVTAFKPVKVFITAEDDGNVQYPGMTKVLETNNF